MSVLNVTIRRICPPAAFAACVQIIASIMQAVQLDIMRLGRSQQSLTSMTERVSRQAAGTNRSIEHHSVFLRSFAGCRSTAADGDWHCAGRASDNGRCQADGPLVGTKPKPVPSCFDNIQRPVCVYVCVLAAAELHVVAPGARFSRGPQPLPPPPPSLTGIYSQFGRGAPRIHKRS